MDTIIRRPINERRQNGLLLDLNDDVEMTELDLGEGCTEDEKTYTYELLSDVRNTFFITTTSYNLLKKEIFKKIYQLSKTIQNIDEKQVDYSQKIMEIVREHPWYYEESLKNTNVYSIPFVYGIELLLRRFGFDYKIDSEELTFFDITKMNSVLEKIQLFIEYEGTSQGQIGAGLIFRICISILEDIVVFYATGSQMKETAILRHNIINTLFGIEKVSRKKYKRRSAETFNAKELKVLYKRHRTNSE